MDYIVVIAADAATAKRFAKRTDEPVNLGAADPARYEPGKRRWGFAKDAAPTQREASAAILSKIRKLLALAENSGATEGEAANAAAAAQRLIEEYQLGAALLDASGEDDKPVSEEPVAEHVEPIDKSKRLVRWRGVLAGGVARANGCRHYWHYNHDTDGREIRLVGAATRINAVRYLYAYLVREIDRLGTDAARGRGRAYGHSWRVGCAARVSERLREAAKQGREEARAKLIGSGVALARVDAAIEGMKNEGSRAASWMDTNLKLANPKRSKLRDVSAYQAGQAAGDRIKLGGRASLGAPAKRVRGGS